MSQQRTVRVRIAVAVDADGRWSACGWSRDDGGKASDASMMNTAVDGLGEGSGEARYFIEADVMLPIPTVAQTISGEVSSAD